MSIELPEGAILSHSITVASYLTSDGGTAYMVHTSGDSPMTSYLGLLIVAQSEILKWTDEDD